MPRPHFPKPVDSTSSPRLAIDSRHTLKKHNAFLGILLHESTHVVDYVKNITPYTEQATKTLSRIKGEKIEKTPFIAEIWEELSLPKNRFNFKARKNVSFYGFKKGPKINISEAINTYKQLSSAPFASLYGAQSWAEDLAEFLTFYHLTQKLKQPYIIKVLRKGVDSCSLQPMKSEEVMKRFKMMEEFYK